MIARIVGTLKKVLQDRIIVDVGSISCEVLVPANDIGTLTAKEGEEISLETIFYLTGNLQVAQFTPVLLGFLTGEDKEFFERFVSVGGIGSRAALRAIARSPSEIARAIERGDLAFLASLPGIGNKRASKIASELKGKMGRFIATSEGVDKAQGRPSDRGEGFGPIVQGPEVCQEALEVLLQLGHKRAEAEKMVRDAWERIVGEGRESKIRGSEDMISEIYRLYGDKTPKVGR